MWWCRCRCPSVPPVSRCAVAHQETAGPRRPELQLNLAAERSTAQGQGAAHLTALATLARGNILLAEAARPGTCGSSAPCNGLVCQCGVDTGHGSGRPEPRWRPSTQPSPAQPSPAVMSQSVASLCRPAGRAAVYTDTAPHINTALVLPPSLCGPEPPQRWSRLFCSAVRGPSRRSLSSSCSDPRRPS